MAYDEPATSTRLAATPPPIEVRDRQVSEIIFVEHNTISSFVESLEADLGVE